MQEYTSTRSNALIDPGLHVWHGEVPAYLFLGGLVAGVMVLAGLWMLRAPEKARSRALSLLPWAAPVLLSLGMLFLWLDLENRWNVARFYLTFELTSPMSWGAWILLAIYPASILLALRMLPTELRACPLSKLAKRVGRTELGQRLESSFMRLTQWVDGHTRGIALANVVLGAALGIYTGILLGSLGARPLWSSAILGPLFLVSGLSTGAAFMMLYGLKDSERISLGRADMTLIVVELALIGLWLTGLVTGGAVSREAAGVILGGPYTAAFWTLVVTLGLMAPLVAEWLELRHGEVPGRVAAVLVLVGGFALRWILVYAGQHTDWMMTALR
ncbi:MAG: NrfD/PsrC family molybdoenzyme membrane anchor subunit [Candidatus Longimicrobiales bacterium M2_2A_002]